MSIVSASPRSGGSVRRCDCRSRQRPRAIAPIRCEAARSRLVLSLARIAPSSKTFSSGGLRLAAISAGRNPDSAAAPRRHFRDECPSEKDRARPPRCRAREGSARTWRTSRQLLIQLGDPVVPFTVGFDRLPAARGGQLSDRCGRSDQTVDDFLALRRPAKETLQSVQRKPDRVIVAEYLREQYVAVAQAAKAAAPRTGAFQSREPCREPRSSARRLPLSTVEM